MRLDEAKRDYFRKLAKEKGYKSRAAFKLIEANKRYGLFKRGDRVIDFGAAPGGWAQVAAEVVGKEGLVVAVDVLPVRLSLGNLRVIQSDVDDASALDKISELIPKADAILSDIAPQVSGTWELDHYRQVELTMTVLELAGSLLREGGKAMIKVFEGERTKEVQKRLSEEFKFVRITKPKASRSSSSEVYIVCLGYRG